MDVEQTYGDSRKARQATWAAVVLWSALPVAACAAEQDPRDKFRDCPECPEMVVVLSGSFMMGSPESGSGRKDREGSVHEVTIACPFAVGARARTTHPGEERR